MVPRVSWVGVGVGALAGGLIRVGVTALHFPDIVRGPYLTLLVPAIVGIAIGSAAAATGSILLGAAVGAGLSLLFYLGNLVFTFLAVLLGAGTLPALWEVLAVGAISGAIGGAAGQIGTRRSGGPGGQEVRKTPLIP